MFKFTGTWESNLCPTIKGIIDFELPLYDTLDFETIVYFTYDPNSPFRPEEQISVEMTGISDSKKYLLRTTRLDTQQYVTISLCKDSTIQLSGVYTSVNPKDIGNMSIKCTETCWGCIEDQPNQMAHADPGGCLYETDSDSTIEM